MKVLMAVCIIIFFAPALCIGGDFRVPNKFKKDETIEAEKFNQNYQEIEKEITALKESLKDTQDSLARLQSFDSQLKEVEKNMVPKGTVAAFALLECPNGWSNFDEGAGRVILGVGKGAGLTEKTFMQKGGEEVHKLTIDEMPKHKHTWIGVNADRPDEYGFGGSERNVHRAAGSINDISDEQGGDQPHNNMPPFVTLLFCKKN